MQKVWDGNGNAELYSSSERCGSRAVLCREIAPQRCYVILENVLSAHPSARDSFPLMKLHFPRDNL